MHITTSKEGISSQIKAIFSRIFKTAKSKTTRKGASKTVALFLVFSVISWLFGVPLGVLVPIHEAQAQSISAVSAADTDATGYDIDGRDFSVTWTPGTSPSGYAGTKIFILPNATTVAADTIMVNACGGQACIERGFLSQFQNNTFTLPTFSMSDSAGTSWNAGTQYKACVLIDATTDELSCSSAFTVTSDTVSDANAPIIDFMSVNIAQEAANAVMNAIIRDDQTIAAEFAAGTGGAYFRIYYGADVSTAESSANAVSVEGNMFSLTVPSAAVPAAGGTFEYYLIARDKSANMRFFCANPSANDAVACKNSPFIVTTVAASALVRSVSGTVNANTAGVTAALDSARIFAAGFAKAAVTSGGDGTYTITGLPNNNSFDFTAYKTGYCGNRIFETIGTSDKTGVNLNLNAGECGFYSGGGAPGGDSTPHVIFTGPPDQSNYVPLNEKIRVGLNMPLDASTVNDLDASNVGSNIYLTTNDGTTKVAGSVLWCPSQASAGCSTIPSMDTNTILFSPAASLTASTFYSLIITEAVVSEGGQAIQGSRPGGGHRISFTTGGDSFNQQTITDNFGQGGQYLPPFVRSTVPAPGMSARPNTKVLVEFDQAMNSSTITTTSIKLAKMVNGIATYQTVTVSLDNNESRFVTITPSASLAEGEYEIQVLGSVANAQGMTMRGPNEASSVAFRNNFWVSGTNDETGPTVYPLLANNSTGVAVNVGSFEFGFNEQLAFSTVSPTNITLSRGATSVSVNIMYDPGPNTVFVNPNTVLAPNTTYTITIGTGVTDLAGNPLGSAATYTYTTGDADGAPPTLQAARCDDYTCYIEFTEPMNHDTQSDSNYANSVLNNANWTIQRTAPDVAAIDITGKPINYNAKNYSVTIEGVAGLAASNSFRVTAAAALKDISGNALNTTSGANIFNGMVENSQATFGNFSGGGMFGPPVAGIGAMDSTSGTFGGTIGGEFKTEGFGMFTAEQFGMGQADMAYPFNPMASQDSNVFQVRFSPGAVLQDGDLVVLTFPAGTNIASTAPDTYSPFYADFNESMGTGTVTFGTLDTDGISVDTTARTVTVELDISSGTPGASDSYTIDLRKIVNPAVPKGPETGGYTVGIKVSRGGEILVNKTSMPYFIMAGGTNSITVKFYAGTAGTGTLGANGDVHMWGGGPGGPMDKLVTLTDGITTASDGTAIAGDAGIQYSNLPDGCYNFGTEPYVALGGVDYFGQMSPEPVCVNSTTPNATKNIVLTSASGAGTMSMTVKLAGIADFGGVDIDIFAGGPGRFVSKTLSNVGVPNANGYTVTLNSNGMWNIGVGPAMPKGTSGGMIPKSLPGVAPPPTDIIVSGLPGTGAIAQGFMTPPGVSVNTTTKTITFTFAAADKTVSGTVTDGTSGLANVHVFMHALGFGQPAFTMTKSDGSFSLSVSDYGSYEIGVSKDGLPPVMNNIEIRPDGADADTNPDIFYKGKQITNSNPLVIKLKKGSYTISGKVLDANNNSIGYAPIFATDTDGNLVNGGTSSDGSYSIFVDAGTWTVKSMLPPNKTDICGTLEKTVTISTESKANQNITPSAGTCYTVSGTVTVAGSPLTNAPLFVDEWDTTNDRPVMGGTFKSTNTDSSGAYSVKVKGNAIYHIGTWSPDYGELSVTQAVTTSDVANVNINSGTTGTVTLSFTGGSASHEAFIELKKSNDVFTRMSKTVKGLASDVTFTMKEGTYNYFVDVFGVGKYSGAVATGATATINLSGLSLVTLSGNVKDEDSSNVSGALIIAKASDGTVKTATTDSSGNYSLSVKAGTYTVGASKAQYIAGQAPASVALTTTTSNYDFGGADPDQTALNKTDQVITGTIYQSNGTTAATTAMVTATESTTGITVTAPVDSVTGVYNLPVDDGTWTVKAVAPLHAKTSMAGTVVTSGTTDQENKNVTLTADATKVPVSASASLSAASGGSVNDTDNTGMKLIAGQGVLEAGNVTVSLNMEKTFTAPDTDTFEPLADAAFTIEAQNAESSSSIKDLKGNAEIQINYASLLSSLPSGVEEGDLKLAYYSTEKDAYVPVEGGFAVDASNNMITGQVNHFTDFAIVYSPVAAAGRSGSGDLTPPSAPTNVQASISDSKIILTWTDPADTDLSQIIILRNSGGDTPISGTTYAIINAGVKTYTDASVEVGKTYKYILRAKDSSGNTETNTIAYSVTVVAGEAAPSAPTTGEEVVAEPTPAEEEAAPAEEVVVTPTEVRNLAAERKALPEFTRIYGRLPQIKADWDDLKKLATGAEPRRSLSAEKNALADFGKLYGRMPESSKDWQALHWMAYGVKPDKRSLVKEAGALVKYFAVYHQLPVEASDWHIVRSLAYVLEK